MPPVAVTVAVPSLVPQPVGFVLVVATLGAPGAVTVIVFPITRQPTESDIAIS